MRALAIALALTACAEQTAKQDPTPGTGVYVVRFFSDPDSGCADLPETLTTLNAAAPMTGGAATLTMHDVDGGWYCTGTYRWAAVRQP